MTKNLAIVFLLGVCTLLTHTLVVVENQRYAYQVGMCRDTQISNKALLWDYKCQASVETRTAWWWHLYYAVKES